MDILTADNFQFTLDAAFALSGRGIHSNRVCSLIAEPAPADHGIVFELTQGDGEKPELIPATLDSALGNQHSRQTILGDINGAHIATPEHLLSALRAMGVDNALIRVDACELPFLDGGSADFTAAITEAGLKRQDQVRSSLRIDRAAAFTTGNDARFSCHPFPGLVITCFIDFGDRVVGRQGASLIVSPELYSSEIAPARTIAFEKEIEALRSRGLGQGGSLESVVVIGEETYLNERLHFPDEVVRHKILDLIGDLALLGSPVEGHIFAEKSGHADHIRFAQFLKEKFA